MYKRVTIRYARLQTNTFNQLQAPLSTPGTVDAKRKFDAFSQLWEENGGGGEEPADRRGGMVEIGPADRQEERKKGCEDRGTGEDVGDDGDGNVPDCFQIGRQNVGLQQPTEPLPESQLDRTRR